MYMFVSCEGFHANFSKRVNIHESQTNFATHISYAGESPQNSAQMIFEHMSSHTCTKDGWFYGIQILKFDLYDIFNKFE